MVALIFFIRVAYILSLIDIKYGYILLERGLK